MSTGTLGTQVGVRTGTGLSTGTVSIGTVGTQGEVRTGTQSMAAYLGAVRTGTVGTQGGVRTGTESLAETTFSAFPQSPTSLASQSSFTPVSVDDAAHHSALQRLYSLPEASRLLNSDFLLFNGVVTAREIDMLAEFDVISTSSNQQWFQRHSEIVQDVMLRIAFDDSYVPMIYLCVVALVFIIPEDETAYNEFQQRRIYVN